MEYRDSWLRRMERMEAAELMAIAFGAPEKLAVERTRIEADAAERPVTDVAAVAEALAEAVALSDAISAGKVGPGRVVKVH